jgi:hypothetical protein
VPLRTCSKRACGAPPHSKAHNSTLVSIAARIGFSSTTRAQRAQPLPRH